MTIRMFPASGAQVSATVPPPPAPAQRAYTAGQSMTATTNASTATSSAVLNFGANNVPSFIQVGMQVADKTTTGAIISAQTVQSFDIAAGTVTLSANVDAQVASGDTIAFARLFVDVPGDRSDDAAAIQSRGFVAVATSGTTSSRPPYPKAGDWHVDATLKYAVVFDGSSWRNPFTGFAV